jgi:lysozyme
MTEGGSKMIVTYLARAGIVAACVWLSACVTVNTAGPRDLPNLTSGVQSELTPDELARRETSRDLPPADWAPLHPRGLALTKSSEGWVAKLYNDAAGYCTIGYGHLIKKARCDGSEHPRYRPSITTAFGTELLVSDMTGARRSVFDGVKVAISDAQHAALADFVFNVGGANFRNSTLLKKINAKQFDQVPSQFRRWTKAKGKVYPGLVTRREKEISLFFNGDQVPKGVPAADDDLSPVDIATGEGG